MAPWGDLARLGKSFREKVERAVSGRRRMDGEALEALEDALLAADLGPALTVRFLAALDGCDGGQAKAVLRAKLLEALAGRDRGLLTGRPTVQVLVGVNGGGKTTTAGKLAWQAKQAGRRPLLVAGDTYRAAAAEQLRLWAARAGCDVVAHAEGGDAAAVAFDGMKRALARGFDPVIVDTAGRLHTKGNLLQELAKVVRVIGTQVEGAPHEVLLVVDASTGLNGLEQARSFAAAVPLTGLVVTKLDGTARGGVLVAVEAELGIPVKLSGLGERPEDLVPFVPESFVDALLPA